MPNAPVVDGSLLLGGASDLGEGMEVTAPGAAKLPGADGASQVIAFAKAAVVDHGQCLVVEPERQLGGALGVVGVLDQLMGQGASTAQVGEGGGDRLQVIPAAIDRRLKALAVAVGDRLKWSVGGAHWRIIAGASASS
jgi:hypothetical protein